MATVEQTMMKVQRILTGPMDLKVQLEDNAMTVQFEDSSTQLRIAVLPWGENDEGDPETVVQISAPILWDVEPSPELYEWVARSGTSYVFGHVVTLDDPQHEGKLFIMMTHTLLGDYLDEAELAAAMWGVLVTADELDDEMQAHFGGLRWADV